MNLILIAPPAGGKGTLASNLKEKYGYAHISTGQILREVDPNTEVGKIIADNLKEGKLVDDKITRELLFHRLQEDDAKNGFILDGYPRNMEQVETINYLCEELGFEIDAIIYLNVPIEIILRRVLGRQTCPNCGKIYNKFSDFFKPKSEGICDICNVELEVRSDDNEESLKKRFNTFNSQTFPIIDFYKKQGKVIEIGYQENPDDTFKIVEENLRRIND